MSELIPFFKDKNVFITGGTGFVGKLVVEQLLRKCEPNKIYLLVRHKKNVEPNIRLQQMFNEAVFEKLKQEKPSFFKKIEIVDGDMKETNLGISEEIRKKIIENVDIVIHGAANIRFNESLRIATDINVKGTLTIINLCHEIKNLEALVYVSTAFAFCKQTFTEKIEEKFYPVPITADQLINKMDGSIGNKSTDSSEKDFDSQIRFMHNESGYWPNTYTFSKAIAESAIQNYAKKLPTSIVRLAIVTGTIEEPVPGWTDNINGPIAIALATEKGLLSVIPCSPTNLAYFVPCDKAAAFILAVIYKTSITGKKTDFRNTNEIAIYNYVPPEEGLTTYGDYLNIVEEQNELKTASRLYFMLNGFCVTNWYLFRFYSFYRDFLPVIILNLVVKFGTSLPGIRNFIKAYKQMVAVSYFALHYWKFSTEKTNHLWTNLNEEDKKLFNFNLKSINWFNYHTSCLSGVKTYLLKEKPENFNSSVLQYKVIKILQMGVCVFFYLILALVFSKIFSMLLL